MMADITMCKGTDCQLKETCYRYTATPNEYRQSYFIEIYYKPKTKTCEEYWRKLNDK